MGCPSKFESLTVNIISLYNKGMAGSMDIYSPILRYKNEEDGNMTS